VTTTKAHTLLVGLFGTADNATFTAPPGMTERVDVAFPGGRPVPGGDGEHGPGPLDRRATSARAATASLSAANVGQLVALAP